MKSLPLQHLSINPLQQALLYIRLYRLSNLTILLLVTRRSSSSLHVRDGKAEARIAK